ncbi:MAG: exo-alpha-sialidase, partial [Opitutaceae bacterium]|nr:exo-alpha-sialidase [Opitutaceae bacterium]
ISSPAGPGANAPGLIHGADGSVWLSWLEPKGTDVTALRAAKFDAAAGQWSPVREIAAGRDWFVNWADTPMLAVQPGGRLNAVWFVSNSSAAGNHGDHAHHGAGYQAWFSQSDDDGVSWSEPARLTTESDNVEFVSLQPLAGGDLLTVWLDGRAKHTDAAAMRLYGRILDGEGPDQLIDDSVCDCCPTTLTAFPDGSALVAYRARREGEVRDIYTARFREGRWENPRLLNNDDWRIHGCPVNGPRLDSVGGTVAAAWFTAADDEPRVLASLSPDAGARFILPQRVDLGNPFGRVDTVLLRDGSRLVIWIEAGGGQEAGIYLRRISPADEIGPPVLLAATSQARASGFPRLALVKDYDATPAQLLLAYTEDREPSAVHTRLLTLPTLSALAGRKPCLPCDEDDANAVRGYAMKGVVSQVQPGRELIWVQLEEIPGVMRATTLACRAEPALFEQLTPGQPVLGRIEKRGRDWWLFNVKLLGAPTP